MKPFKRFTKEDKSFWFFIRFISEKLGYSKKGEVLSYSREQIEDLCKREDVFASSDRINQAVDYCQMRADTINTIVQDNLMDADLARHHFEQMKRIGSYHSKFIMNKQSGEKKKVNYFTAIITMLAEDALGNGTSFDPDPRGLIYILNNKTITGASSRRFDGAYPSIYSPKLVWEIKEYYYSKSFGSRVADAVYEAELDGYELNEIFSRTGQEVRHVMFIDGKYTFWNLGKSYLCRFIDTLNMGLIDDLIIGKEVFTEWPAILSQYKEP